MLPITRQDQGWATIGQADIELGRTPLVIQRNRDASTADDPIEGLEELDGIACENTDPVSRLDPIYISKQAAYSVSTPVQLTIAYIRPISAHDCTLIRKARASPLNPIRDIHQKSALSALVP